MGIWQLDMPSIEDGVRSALAGKRKSDAHRRIEASRDHGHPDFHLDYANEGREAQGPERRQFWWADSRRIVR